MTNKNRKCIVQDISYKESSLYLESNGMYSGNLYKAGIFDEHKLPEYLKNKYEYKIIFLDSKEGLELLFNEIKMLDLKIPQEEDKLNEMKKGRKNLYNSNPKMLSEIIKKYNKNTSGGLIQVSSDTEKRIINQIANDYTPGS